MMNIMFVLLAKKAFPDAMEGVSSKNCFACSARVFKTSFCINNLIDL